MSGRPPPAIRPAQVLHANEIELAPRGAAVDVASAAAPCNGVARDAALSQPAAGRLEAQEVAQRLQSMGFEAAAVLRAIAQSGGQMQAALDVLTSDGAGGPASAAAHAAPLPRERIVVGHSVGQRTRADISQAM